MSNKSKLMSFFQGVLSISGITAYLYAVGTAHLNGYNSIWGIDSSHFSIAIHEILYSGFLVSIKLYVDLIYKPASIFFLVIFSIWTLWYIFENDIPKIKEKINPVVLKVFDFLKWCYNFLKKGVVISFILIIVIPLSFLKILVLYEASGHEMARLDISTWKDGSNKNLTRIYSKENKKNSYYLVKCSSKLCFVAKTKVYKDKKKIDKKVFSLERYTIKEYKSFYSKL